MTFKNLFLLTFISIISSNFSFAQDNSTLRMAFASDDLELFSRSYSNTMYNDCVSIGLGEATFLSISVQTGAKKIFKKLMENNVDLNKACEEGKSPLYFAAKYQRKEMFKTLVMKGADVNISHNGMTLLELVKRHRNKEMEELILNAKAKK